MKNGWQITPTRKSERLRQNKRMKDGEWNFRVFRITGRITPLLIHVTREKMALRVHFTTMEINVTRVFSWITSIKKRFWSLKLELYMLKTNDQVSCALSWESISESFTSSRRIAPGLVFKYIELTFRCHISIALGKYKLLCDFVIYLDFHSTKQALWLVDSWSRAPNQTQMYLDRDKIAQLLPARRIQRYVYLFLPYDFLRESLNI